MSIDEIRDEIARIEANIAAYKVSPRFDGRLYMTEELVMLHGGERALRNALQTMQTEELRGILRAEGMDPAKNVGRKSREQIIEHIVMVAVARAKKGDRFGQESR